MRPPIYVLADLFDCITDLVSSCRTDSVHPRYSLELPIPTDVK